MLTYEEGQQLMREYNEDTTNYGDGEEYEDEEVKLLNLIVDHLIKTNCKKVHKIKFARMYEDSYGHEKDAYKFNFMHVSFVVSRCQCNPKHEDYRFNTNDVDSTFVVGKSVEELFWILVEKSNPCIKLRDVVDAIRSSNEV